MDAIPPSAASPVSIVIPARDAARGLKEAVRSALDQAHAGPIEIVIAVGPSTDETAEIADDFAADPRIRVVPNTDGGTAAGLNAAIAAATGEVIVRCDAHSVLPPGYVKAAVDRLATTTAAVVGGMQVPVGATGFERAVAMATSSRFGAGGARHRVGGRAGAVDTVYLGVFRRDVLSDVGGYDQRFVRSQDAELNHRIRASGRTVWFDPELRVEYRPRGSIGGLWHQYFQYGWWKQMMARVHSGTLRPRQLVPAFFVLALALSLIALPFAPIPALVVPGLYVVVLVAETVRQLIRRRDPAALLLVAAYPTIHLAWGLGFFLAQARALPEK